MLPLVPPAEELELTVLFRSSRSSQSLKEILAPGETNSGQLHTSSAGTGRGRTLPRARSPTPPTWSCAAPPPGGSQRPGPGSAPSAAAAARCPPADRPRSAASLQLPPPTPRTKAPVFRRPARAFLGRGGGGASPHVTPRVARSLVDRRRQRVRPRWAPAPGSPCRNRVEGPSPGISGSPPAKFGPGCLTWGLLGSQGSRSKIPFSLLLIQGSSSTPLCLREDPTSPFCFTAFYWEKQ